MKFNSVRQAVLRWQNRGVRRLATLGAVGVVIALGGVASAEASPGFTIQPAKAFKYFGLRGSAGYTVFVAIEGRRAAIEAISRESSVRYTVPVRIKQDRITARIGRLGVLSMRFLASGPFSPTMEPQGDCHGRRAQVQHGVFEGKFRWRGEMGFSAARTHRVAGLSVRSFREVCRGESAAVGRDEAEKPLVLARRKSARELREVEAYDLAANGVTLVARVAVTQPFLFIERTVFGKGNLNVDAEGNQVIVGDELFRGSAELRANPNEEERWRGNLEANFPGLSYIPLVGKEFEIEQATAPPVFHSLGLVDAPR
jgi:hypothetical protein